MVYVMSDTHGDIDRFKIHAVRRLKKKDTLIILGDFGFLWSGSAAEKRTLKWLSTRPYTLLFLDGSHENFDLLAQYPTVEFAGGQAQQIGERLYRLERGEIYTLEDKTFLTFGGAESLDREAREEGITWWPQELPTAEEYARCNAALDAHGHAVDYILTHDGPTRLLSFLKLNRDSVLYEENALEYHLNEVMKNTRYTMWCFGRYHLDQNLGPAAAEVYRKVLPLWKAVKPSKKSRAEKEAEKATAQKDDKNKASSAKADAGSEDVEFENTNSIISDNNTVS